MPMDSATAVNTSAAISLLGFAAIIFLLLFLIARWKWHVFFALSSDPALWHLAGNPAEQLY